MPAAEPLEFRRRAVELARRREQPIAQIAKDLGISESCLRRWMDQADVDDGHKEGLSSTERRELVELRRRTRVLEMELAYITSLLLLARRDAGGRARHTAKAWRDWYAEHAVEASTARYEDGSGTVTSYRDAGRFASVSWQPPPSAIRSSGVAVGRAELDAAAAGPRLEQLTGVNTGQGNRVLDQ